METRRWVNQSHPQTLQIAVLLFYLDAVFNVLFGAIFNPLGLLITVAEVAAGLLIANERKAGYWLGVAVSAVWLLLVLSVGGGGDIIGLLFAVARLALLLHPQSRDYQRIWFR